MSATRHASQLRRWPAGLVAGLILGLLLMAALVAPEHLPDVDPSAKYASPAELPGAEMTSSAPNA